MADEKPEIDDLEEMEDEETGGRRGGTILVALVALAGLAGGGFAGASMLGPNLAPVLAERAMKPKAEGGKGGGHGKEAATSLHMIDNLVVNPAASGGTRFLLVSIAVDTHEADMADVVASHDVELRDALIVVLGSKTVDELTDVTLRPAITKEIFEAVEKITGHGVVARIYIPQFVIQ